MIEINLRFVEKVFHPFGTMEALGTQEDFAELDASDRDRMLSLMQKYLVPNYNRWPEKFKTRVKQALMFFLSTTESGEFDYQGIIDAMPFDVPKNPRQLILWAWEVLYPGEDFHIDDLSKYTVNNKIWECNLF